MKYLILSDIETDEELNRIELERVNSIAIFTGKELNEGALIYGVNADNSKEYIVILYDEGDGFIAAEKFKAYVQFK